MAVGQFQMSSSDKQQRSHSMDELGQQISRIASAPKRVSYPGNGARAGSDVADAMVQARGGMVGASVDPDTVLSAKEEAESRARKASDDLARQIQAVRDDLCGMAHKLQEKTVCSYQSAVTIGNAVVPRSVLQCVRDLPRFVSILPQRTRGCQPSRPWAVVAHGASPQSKGTCICH